MINELKENLEELKILEEIADIKEKEWEADPLNKEKEAAEHKAYTDEWNKFMEVANQINEITDGKIDLKIAREMLRRDKRNELVDIIEKYTDKTQDFNANQDKTKAADRNSEPSQQKCSNPVGYNIARGMNR